jgi:hypothetical protein
MALFTVLRNLLNILTMSSPMYEDSELTRQLSLTWHSVLLCRFQAL